jgi:tetratricopeptide (TPR) repeat protein
MILTYKKQYNRPMNKLAMTVLFLSLFPATIFAATPPAPSVPAAAPAIAPPVQPANQPVAQAAAPAAPPDAQTQQLIIAYNYAYSLYEARKFDQAKDLFRKLAAASMQPIINGNSLYYYSQCAFRTGDYDGCVKGLDLLAKRWPNSPAIKKGYVSRFATFLIAQVTALQTNWDYFRYKDSSVDEKGADVWKESVPAGYKIKKINFKLGFGLYKILMEIEPTSSDTLAAKQKLDVMLNQPIKVLWADEKAPATKYGHPADFYSSLSIAEKKQFSKVICERMFYNWQNEKMYQFFDIYDDVQNLKPKFVARTKEFVSSKEDLSTASVLAFNSRGSIPGSGLKPPMVTEKPELPKTYKDPTAVLTLANLFQVTGYNPYTDTFTNLIESLPAEPSM